MEGIWAMKRTRSFQHKVCCGFSVYLNFSGFWLWDLNHTFFVGGMFTFWYIVKAGQYQDSFTFC